MYENKELYEDSKIFLNHLSDIMDKAIIKKSSDRQLILSGLMTKIMDGAHATIILLEKWYSIEADYVVRPLLEALFYLGACNVSDDAVRDYIGDPAFSRLSDLNLILHNREHFKLSENEAKEFEERKTCVKQEITSKELIKLTAERAARIANVFSLYMGYRLHSAISHASSNHLKEDYMRMDDDVIYQIDIGPKPKRSNDVLHTLAVILALTCSWGRQRFNVNSDVTIQNIEGKYITA